MEDSSQPPEPAWVEHVALEDFRNYRRLAVELSPRFNVLSGRNGQGKTSLLEGLFLVGTSRLLRGQKDGEAIRDESNSGWVSVEMSPSRTQLKVLLERGIRKRVLINGLGLPRASDVIGRLPIVSISTADMELVRGEPSERRLFLDLELSAQYPSYLRRLSVYKRALEHRNALLKEARERPIEGVQFEAWEEHLATAGAALRDSRIAYVAQLRLPAIDSHFRLGAGETLDLEYVPRDEWATVDQLRDALAATRQVDIARGSTQPGPHRDDLAIRVDGRDARIYGSQGQQRTAVIAIKLASMNVTAAAKGSPPLLLLDDIFSDLDDTRRSRLVEIVLEGAGQVVLTCTEPAAAGPDIIDQARVFRVADGQVDLA